jgi:hypothetical protein
MDGRDGLPIACTLQAGSYQERLEWIAALARDGLRDVSRDDLRLELRFTPDVAARVREMRLTITAPERAREVADTLFEQFVQPM